MEIRAHLTHRETQKDIVVSGSTDFATFAKRDEKSKSTQPQAPDVQGVIAALQEQGYALKAVSGKRIKPV